MPKRTQSQSVCAGPIKRRGVGDEVTRGSGVRKMSGGSEHKGTASGDPAAPAFVKQNFCSGGPKI